MNAITPIRGRAPRHELLVALGLALAPVIALGFSRFAYALLLPPMRDDLDWTYTAAGGMNTANALGYIAGAATAALWAKRFGLQRAFIGTLVLSAAALTLTAATSDYAILMALRVTGGIATAIAFVVGSSLAARLRGSLLPVYFAGVGLGIVASGIVVPSALAGDAPDDWRVGWLLLGLVSLIALLPAWLAARAVPEQRQPPVATLSRAELRKLHFTFIGYILFGAGYVSYMTFVIALLRGESMPSWVPTAFWIVLGVASAVFIGPWGRHLAQARGGNGQALVYGIVLLGTLPILFHVGPVTALISAVVFGSAFMAGPTAVTAISRHVLQPGGWTAGIALMTTAFALGQAIGPLLSGILSDGSGGLKAGLWLSPIFLAAAAAVAYLQDHHPHHSEVAHLAPTPEDEWKAVA
jgi:predicted MFS family arabinose efflux permease